MINSEWLLDIIKAYAVCFIWSSSLCRKKFKLIFRHHDLIQRVIVDEIMKTPNIIMVALGNRKLEALESGRAAVQLLMTNWLIIIKLNYY